MHQLKKLLPFLTGLTLAILLSFLVGCSDSNGASREGRAENAAPRLASGWTSSEALVRHALERFAARDTAGLQELLITREEFEQILYPELGRHYAAARDQRPEARAFIWENHAMSSQKALRKAYAELAGRTMTLRSVSFPKGGTSYGSYTIYEEPDVSIALDDGTTAEMSALGSIVEIDGRYRLMSYRDRE